MSIQDELAAVQAQGGQGALDQWLATTQYTPAELHQATGYNVSDITQAINSAQMAVNPYDYANDNLQSQGAAEKWSPEYAAVQDDLYSIRQLMAQQGAGYMTDTGSNGASTYAYLPGMAAEKGVAITPGMSSAYQRATGSAYQPGTQVTGYDPATNKYELGAVTPASAPADSLDTMRIKSQLAELSASGDQNALNRWLSTTPYSADQLAAASGYNLSDVQAAIASAKTSSAQAPLSSSFVTGGTQQTAQGSQPTPQAPQPAPQPASQTPQLGGLGQIAANTQIPVSQSVSTPPTIKTDNAQPDDVIRSWFTANPGWTPEMLKNYMDSYGITPEQMARATANSPNIMVQRYNDTGKLPAQAGAQTQYVDYNQPLAPVAEGAGSGNLPYYYDTPTGKLSSYFKPSYWRGNAPAYGGMIRFAEGGMVKSTPPNAWLEAKCNG